MNNLETNVAYDPNDASKELWKRWDIGAWVRSRTDWNPTIFDNTYPKWNPGGQEAPGIPGVSGTYVLQMTMSTILDFHR